MSLEQIKMDLEKDIVKNKSKLETWKRVTYLKKKMDHHIKLWLKILKMQSMEAALILFI